MRLVLLNLIRMYQNIPGNFHNCCRHIPTCSEYSFQVILKYGSIKGSYLSFRRILKCNPFMKHGFEKMNKEV